MPRVRQVKTTFTAGEVSRDLLGRGDLRAYENGAQRLRNMFIFPTGGITRRAGLGYIDTVPSDGRLMSFAFNTEQTFLLVFSDRRIDIYLDGVKQDSVEAPWRVDQIGQLSWTQSADTLLLVHPEVPPKKLTRNPGSIWLLEDWEYIEDDDGRRHQPYFKYAPAPVTLTPSAISGEITLTASADIFTPGHEGTRLRFRGVEATITDFDSPTVVSASVAVDLPDLDPSVEWAEQAFSAPRGYPVTVAFHQDRLVIGGCRYLPNRLWFSKSGDLFNFDLGEGLDDEAIEFSVLSDQVNAIRGVFSGRHLQVFTSGAEWQVTGDPLTPATVQILRQTRVGTLTDRFIPNVNVDGATLFVARNKAEIREFLFTSIEQAYQATDLALISRHIIQEPMDMDFDPARRLLFLIRGDGKFASLTMFRAEEVAAWTLHETQGKARSVAVVGEDVYLLIERNGGYVLEQFEDGLYLDSALRGNDETPRQIWSGLDHLEGMEVSILADGAIHPPKIVQGGAVSLNAPAHEVQIGLAYTHIVEPLPPITVSDAGTGRAVRLVEGIFRLQNTAALRLDVGRGLKDIALRRLEILDTPPPLVSEDITVGALGWQPDGTQPLWRIEQDVPLPFTLLAVTTELKVND